MTEFETINLLCIGLSILFVSSAAQLLAEAVKSCESLFIAAAFEQKNIRREIKIFGTYYIYIGLCVEKDGLVK